MSEEYDILVYSSFGEEVVEGFTLQELGGIGSLSFAENEEEMVSQIEKRKSDRPHIILSARDEEKDLLVLNAVRWKYPEVGSLLLTNRPLDRGTIRRYGIYDALSQPVRKDDLVEKVTSLAQAIASKKPPQAREADNTYKVCVITERERLIDYFRLRYDVWELMNYMKPERRNASRLEIDPYDNYAIPFGCFQGDEIVALLRLVTPVKESFFADVIEGIVDDANDDVLRTIIESPPDSRIITEESFDISRLIDEIESGGERVCELSRTITHPHYRGLDLSRKVMEFGIAYARFRGYSFAFGACVPQHLPYYAKFGYQPLANYPLAVEKNVEQVAYPVLADFRELPEPTKSAVALLQSQLEERAHQR